MKVTISKPEKKQTTLADVQPGGLFTTNGEIAYIRLQGRSELGSRIHVLLCSGTIRPFQETWFEEYQSTIPVTLLSPKELILEAENG